MMAELLISRTSEVVDQILNDLRNVDADALRKTMVIL
jgi:hypothetical protein